MAMTFQLLDACSGHVAGVAANNPLTADYKDHLRKYAPILASYGLNEAAEYLQMWANGGIKPAPLLDISACPG